jgi:hypothetical protein
MGSLLCRAVFHEYASDPLFSRSPVGRFHDSMAAARVTTYAAGSPDTAWREVTARWRANAAAYRMVRLEVSLSRVLDVTDPSVQVTYEVNRALLTAAEYEPCQALARRARADGFEAIWTYSAADQPDGRQMIARS